MADLLFVTWDGGGNVPPAVGIAQELQRRGHAVRFVGHARQHDSLAAAGFDVARDARGQALLTARRQLTAHLHQDLRRPRPRPRRDGRAR